MGKRAERSRRTYDAMAAGYDRSREGLYTNAHRALIVERAHIGDGDAVLDVGCGNGGLLGALAEKAAIRAFGVDISEGMIAAARERYPGFSFAAQPATPLGFADGSMDAVTVSCAFHHFEDPRAFARECMRVLKAGGAVYIAEPRFPAPLRFVANHIVFPLSRSGYVRVYGARELRAIFEAAGFANARACARGAVLFLSAEKPAVTPPRPEAGTRRA